MCSAADCVEHVVKCVDLHGLLVSAALKQECENEKISDFHVIKHFAKLGVGRGGEIAGIAKR